MIIWDATSALDANSCAVVAMARLTNSEFKAVNDVFLAKGFRKPGTGTRVPVKEMYDMGFIPFLFDLSWLKLSGCPRSYPTGSYYIKIEGHALCMID